MAASTIYLVLNEGGGSEGHAGSTVAGTSGESTVGEKVDHGESTALAEPKQADNPILPVVPELIWGGACFVVLWALMKFVLLKPVVAGMAERDEKVRGDIAAADAARVEAERAMADYQAQLASAKAEATRLIEDARAQGEAERRELLAAAEADAAAVRAAAADEIAAAKAAALGQLRGDVVTIAVQAAGAVIQKPLDVGAQQGVVDEYLTQSSRN